MKSTSKDLWKALREIDMKFTGKNYINGEWIGSYENTYEKANPSTQTILGNFPLTDDDEVGRTVAIARETFKSWKKSNHNNSKFWPLESKIKFAYQRNNAYHRITTK